MAMKRKLDIDTEDLAPLHKQLKLVPFPNFVPDDDVAMSEAEPIYPDQYHLRLPSDASSASSSASDSPLTHSPLYPTFALHPLPFFNPENGTVDPNSHAFSHYAAQSSNCQNAIGLLQPSASAFVHHGSNCTQIPKLRIACASGLNGQRTMWSHCEQCGAIQMVDCD